MRRKSRRSKRFVNHRPRFFCKQSQWPVIRASAIRIRPSGILRFLAPFGVLPPYPLQHSKELHSPLIPQQKHSLPNSSIFSFLIHPPTNHSPRFSHPGFEACNRRRDENWLPPSPIHHALHRAKPNIFPLRILPKNSLSPEKFAPAFPATARREGALVGEVSGQTCPQ